MEERAVVDAANVNAVHKIFVVILALIVCYLQKLNRFQKTTKQLMSKSEPYLRNNDKSEKEIDSYKNKQMNHSLEEKD
jgi:hypothetical protein